MPVSDSQLPIKAKTAHIGMFQREFDAATALNGWQNFTWIPPALTSGDRVTHHWHGPPPRSKSLKHNPLPISGLAKYESTIVTEPMGAGIEIERVAFEDDNLNLIGPRVSQLALAQEYDIGEAVLEQLNTVPNAYDGVALFSDSRTIGSSGTIDNNLTGSGGGSATAPTVAAFQAAISAARTAMAGFCDDKGRKENNRPDAIIVPPGMETIAFIALAGSAFPGQANPVVPVATRGLWSAGGYTVLTNPVSDNGAEVFFVNTKSMHKPLVYQLRSQVGLEIDETRWTRDEIVLYKARGRYGVGPGEPRSIIRFTFTT